MLQDVQVNLYPELSWQKQYFRKKKNLLITKWDLNLRKQINSVLQLEHLCTVLKLRYFAN